MLKNIVLISSVILTMPVQAQDTLLVPSHGVSDCAMSGRCELVFTSNASNSEKSYEVFLMNADDIELGEATSIVFEKYESAPPVFAGLVTESIDTSKVISNVDVFNTYTSYADIEAVEMLNTAFTTDSSLITREENEDIEKKPPPWCPPTCNSFVFISADQYLSESGTSLKSMMSLPALIPVFVLTE